MERESKSKSTSRGDPMAVELERYPEIYQNRRQMLERRLPKIAAIQNSDDGEAIESLCSNLLGTYFNLALLGFVLDADRKAFFDNMFRAAKTHQFLIQAQRSNDEIDWSFINATEIRSTLYALAIGQIELAREISTIQTKEFVRPFDAGDFYLFSMVLRQLVEGDTASTGETLAKFDQARKGNRGAAAQILRALLDRDNQAFDAGVRAFVEEWRTIVNEDNFEDFAGGIQPGEESICVQALAFIRLAEARRMSPRSEYPLVPAQLRRFDDFTPPANGYPVRA
jgi:hypothetical protein